MFDEFLFEYIPSEFYLVSIVLGISGAITSVIMWIIVLISFLRRKQNKAEPNKYLIFGIINFIAGLIIFVVLIVIDVIVYFIQKKKDSGSK